MLGAFIKMFILSFVVGSLIGIICSLFLKKLKHINMGRTQETCVIILFAFISYLSAEQLQLSPIIALLVTGIIMSNYAFYNLSFQAREESR
jgi:NhaP-type Na+/H+ or K+/H+ antiporter